MNLKHIDVNFDFQTDTPPNKDPDSKSVTLKNYQKLIYTKPLPSDKYFDLIIHKDNNKYLSWNEFYFRSDSITASFRYVKYQWMHDKLKKKLPDYEKYIKDYLHKAYTIGGEIIFPVHKWSMNQARGCSAKIRDRFDITLECIRRFYNDKNAYNPLINPLKTDENFFNLFNSFEGYVKFFFLEDLCSPDFKKVNLWLNNDNFNKSPLPQTEDEYLEFIDKELEFVKKRNKRIKEYCMDTI